MKRRWIKAGFDLALGIPIFFLCAPLMACIAALICCTSTGPVFFRQDRPGLNAKIFRLVKFCTMTECRDKDGCLLPDSKRLTALGMILRTTSLDELPELFNVLNGNMSLVGPRPLLARYMPYFSKRERLRFSVNPGITGWAQINGRNESSWSERFDRDIWYVENWSLTLDMKILATTLKHVIMRKNVVPDARSIMLNLDEERAGNLAAGTVG